MDHRNTHLHIPCLNFACTYVYTLRVYVASEAIGISLQNGIFMYLCSHDIFFHLMKLNSLKRLQMTRQMLGGHAEQEMVQI